MYTKSISAAFAASLFASANAHFFIKSPSPIPGSGIKDPLDPSGSNFPCHGVDVSQGSVTPLTAGASQQIEYELGGGANTAVHGGGSCQISVTYETDPAKLKDPSNWKVLQSFIGGCPTNAKGNLVKAEMCNGSNAPECVNALSFNVPQEVQDGNAILAWTWFNNVGNREMYMNCAKVSISGGSGNIGSLPSMAVANLASINSCTTSENFNVDFPDPGKYVTTESPLNYPTKLMAGSGCGSGSGSGGGSTVPAAPVGNTPSNGGSGSTPSNGGSGTTPAQPTTTANDGQSTQAPNPGTSNPGAGSGNPGAGSGKPPSGGIFAPGAGGAPTTLITSAVPVATSAPSTGGSAPAAPPPTGGSTGGSTGGYQGQCGAGQVTCTASGFYCISATQFGMCNWGCATPQDMSAGTECSAGVVKAIALPPQRRRRSARHLHAAVHEHLSPLV